MAQLVRRTHSLQTEFASYGPSDTEFASSEQFETDPGIFNSYPYVRAAVVAARPRRSPSASGPADAHRSGLLSAYHGSAWLRWRREKQAVMRRQNERNLNILAKAASNKEVRYLYCVSAIEC